MMKSLLLLVPLLISGCQRDPAAPTAEENRQLDEAANLLNEAPANLETIDDSGLGATDNLEAPPETPLKDAGAY